MPKLRRVLTWMGCEDPDPMRSTNGRKGPSEPVPMCTQGRKRVRRIEANPHDGHNTKCSTRHASRAASE